MRHIFVLVMFAVATTSALSQGKIFRCGLEYVSPTSTIDEQDALARGCLLIQGGSNAVVPRTPPRVTTKRPAEAGTPSPQAIAVEPGLSSTGTGFFVSASGHLISNAHVVADCRSLVARRATGESFPISIVSIDRRNDLALLKATKNGSYASFRVAPPQLGEAIIVYGFPLAGTLAVSGNLTTGSVSALAGIGNDLNKLQISAPVQPGNSGGAVLDESGLVVGIVQSKLDAQRAQRITGDILHNVDFAIKASVAQRYLKANGVQYEEKQQAMGRKVSAIAEEAVGFTVLVACFK